MEFDLFSLTGAFLCLIYFMAGFIDSVCGGGGLLTIPAMVSAGIPTGMITGTNMCATIIGSFTGTARFVKSRNIHYPSAIRATVLAVAGSVIGSRLNLLVPVRCLQVFMLGMVPILAALMLFKKDVGRENHMDGLALRSVHRRSLAIGFLLGIYQGFYGPGGGMLYMLAFAIFLDMDLLSATGNTRFVAAWAALSASVSYAMSGAIIWNLTAAACVFNIVGSYAGAGFAIRKGSKIIRPLMFLVIGALFVKILLDAWS